MPSPTANSQGRDARRNHGVFYTPSTVADYITRCTVGPLLVESANGSNGAAVRILDPACGDGAFLLAAFRFLLKWHNERDSGEPVRSDSLKVEHRLQILRNQIFGVDQDEAAARAARTALARMCLYPSDDWHDRDTDQQRQDEIENLLRDNIQHGDALIESDFEQDADPPVALDQATNEIHVFDWRTRFPNAVASGGFQAVVGNPPYINIRRLTAIQGSSVKAYLAGKYQAAYRGYDTYVLFVERALELMSHGGRCGFILPNKIASLDYALRCREMLLQQTTIWRIDDLTDARVFPGAGVYPYVVIFAKQIPPPDHRIRIGTAASVDELTDALASRDLKQSTLSARTGLSIHGTLDVESRIPVAPLEDLAKLSSGSTGFQAARVARSLSDLGTGSRLQNWNEMKRTTRPDSDQFEFIVSGNIRRYRIRIGNVRFLHKKYQRPVLDCHGSQLSKAKQNLYTSSKIVIAGMSRRIQAAYDPGGLALGVQVYAVNAMQVDYRYVLGLLNSKLMSYIFQLRFQAKRLSGRYLAINKGQLAQLPMALIDEADGRMQESGQRIIQLVDAMHDVGASAS